MAKGIRVKPQVLPITIQTSPCKAKAVSNHPVSIMSNQEVTRHGYDEAVLMDTQGYVCQGSGENLFWSKTVSCIPQICQGCIGRITRRTVIQLHRTWASKCMSVESPVMLFYISRMKSYDRYCR